MPARLAEKKKEKRADNDNTDNAPGVHRMKLAHFSVGVGRGERGNRWADEHLTETARGGKDHRAECKTEEHAMREQDRCGGVDQKAEKAYHGDRFDGFRNVEAMGKEGENEVDDQLCKKVDQNEKTEQRVGNAVKLAEGQKQNGGKIGNHRGADVGTVAGELYSPYV